MKTTSESEALAQACVDGCLRRGETYYWCNKVVGGWDYCSPRWKLFFEETNSREVDLNQMFKVRRNPHTMRMKTLVSFTHRSEAADVIYQVNSHYNISELFFLCSFSLHCL